MSSLEDFDQAEAGGFVDTKLFSKIVEDPSFFDNMEFDDGDGYDDWNGYFKMSISTAEPDKFVEKHKKEFKGMRWYPPDFFKKIYIKNFMSKANAFLKELQKLDLSEVSRKQSLKENIRKMRTYLKQADKKYAVDQIACLELVSQAMLVGRKIVETLRYLDAQGGLD